MIEASGVNKTLSVEITRGVGYTAIITSWLSSLRAPVIAGRVHSFCRDDTGRNIYTDGIPDSSIRSTDPAGMILFFVLGSEFFIKYKLSIIRENKVEAK